MRIAALSLVLAIGLGVSAQEAFFYPTPGNITVRRDNVFAPTLKFDLYRPANDEVVPVVIFANIGSRAYPGSTQYIGWGEAVAGAGLAGVVYQATTDAALPQFDALMSALRERAVELRIDPARVVVWSCSSNVRVGLPIAMDRKRDYVRGAVVEYGDANVTEFRTDLPVMFVRAGLDTPQLNRNIDSMLSRMLATNAPWTIINYGGGLHGFEVLNDNEVTHDIIRRELAFMRDVTRPEMSRAYRTSGEEASLGSAFYLGDWPAAVTGYRARVTSNPREAESHRRLGIALMNNGRPAEALAALENAWQLGRRGPRDTGMPAAEAAAAAGNIDRAIHWLDVVLSTPFGPPIEDLRTSPQFAAVRNDPRFERLMTGVSLQRRAIELFRSGASEDAMKIVTSSPRFEREDVVNALGYQLLGSGRALDAVAVFRLNAKRHPESWNVWDSLAEGAAAAGLPDEAAKAAERAAQLKR